MIRFGYAGFGRRPRGPLQVSLTPSRRATSALVVVGSLLLAAFFGWVASFGNVLLLIPAIIVFGSIAMAALPPVGLIWFQVVTSVLLVGPAIYFGKFESARWLPTLLALALFVPAMLRLVGDSGDTRRAPPFLWWLLLFLCAVLFSTVLAGASLGESLNAPRYYLAIVPLTLLLYLGVVPAAQMEKLWRLLIAAALIQFPVCVAQYFVFARKSRRGASWDAVVGTFPGDYEGGGASAGMGVFTLTMLIFALALWRAGKLRLRYAATLAVFTVGTVVFAEVKAVVLLIPVAIGLLYFAELSRRPWQTLVAIMVGLTVMAGVLFAYSKFQYASAASSWQITNKPTSPLQAIQNQFDPNNTGEYTHQLGRMASFRDWWVRNVGAEDWRHAVFGFGAASTQVNRIGVGKLAPKFQYPLDQTGTGMLLWETGLLGHLLFAAVLVSAGRLASRLRKQPVVPDIHRALLHAASVGLYLQAMTLPYKSFSLKTAPSQVLLALLLGYVAYWYRTSWVDRSARARTALPPQADAASAPMSKN